MRRFALALAAMVALAEAAAAADTLTLVGFNVESDNDTKPALVAEDLKSISLGTDVFVLTEVDSLEVAEQYRAAAQAGAGASFDKQVSKSGGSDRIVVLWNTQRLEKLRAWELEGTYSRVCRTTDDRVPRFRGTVVVEFKHRPTSRVLWVSGSHFQRDEAFNTCQAQELAKYVAASTIPHIAAGDFNFDWSLKVAEGSRGQRRDGFDELTKDGPFRWIRPQPLIKTYCSDHESVLDFHFAAHRAQSWSGKATILFPEAAYCDPARDARGYSDHRPVKAVFEIR